MKFNLIANGEILGGSELEGADPSIGVRGGKFVPNVNYSKYQHLFREQSRMLIRSLGGQEPPTEYKNLRAQIDALSLRVETAAGEEVPTRHIEFEDFSEDLGEEGYELSIVVDGRSTYEKFFG